MKIRYFAKFLTIALVAVAINSSANAQTIVTLDLEINDNTEFEGQMAGASLTATNDSGDESTTTVDTILSSSDDAFLVNNQFLGVAVDSGFGGPDGGFIDGDATNGGEGITFSFDTDVRFTNFLLAFADANGQQTAVARVDGNPTVFSFVENSRPAIGGGQNSFNFSDPLGDLVLTEGQGITFTGAAVDDNFGIRAFTVDTSPVVSTVPEPSSLAVIGLGSLLMVARRRR